MYKKLMLIQSELKAPKSQFNSFGKYHYRNVEDILEALKPLIKTHECSLMISDEIVLIGERYYIKATVKFIDNETGQFCEVNGYAREEQDKKGMDQMQLTGATSSYARKYALNGMFAIDDTKDSDTTNTHGKSQNATEQQKQPQPTNTPPTQQTTSEAQLKRLYAIAGKKGVTNKQVDEAVKPHFKIEHMNQLTKKQYDQVVKKYEDMPDVAK